ncbi:hypothetical protein LCGC14_2717090 [marine sediment metagenome]|uniref:Methyltransferase domain-containing protein n=1 Tax=marine sediment metagenome TaxID=412755 RepID=A0A0F8ZB50_9ZZZZ
MLDDAWNRSRTRWRSDEQEECLTWGARWTGHAFVAKLLHFCKAQSRGKILEIGPGYGRILEGLLKEKVPFEKYVGIELSPSRTRRLSKRFADDHRISFLVDDVETFMLSNRFSLCFSSATFSHLFPNFKKAAVNIREHLVENGYLAFDTSPGHLGRFQSDGVTYGKDYEPEEIKKLLQESGYSQPIISSVNHGQDAHGQEVVLLFTAAQII